MREGSQRGMNSRPRLAGVTEAKAKAAVLWSRRKHVQMAKRREGVVSAFQKF